MVENTSYEKQGKTVIFGGVLNFGLDFWTSTVVDLYLSFTSQKRKYLTRESETRVTEELPTNSKKGELRSREGIERKSKVRIM